MTDAIGMAVDFVVGALCWILSMWAVWIFIGLVGALLYTEISDENACVERGGVYKRSICFDPKVLK